MKRMMHPIIIWAPPEPDTSRQGYLVGVDLPFLAEAWRHVLVLDLLLGQVVLVLVEKMLVLHLWGGHTGRGEDRDLRDRGAPPAGAGASPGWT